MSNFIPTRFTTPVVAPQFSSIINPIPYISPSEYRFAPTSLATNALVAGDNNLADSTASLFLEIEGASSWINEMCFHGEIASLSGSVVTESDYFTVKSSSRIEIICNAGPILEVLGIGVGPDPSNMSNIQSTNSQTISIDGNIIKLFPFSLPAPINYFPATWPSYNGRTYIVWQYVSGFPHTYLTASTLSGATTLPLSATDISNTELVGADSSTLPKQFTIKDGANTEKVIITSMSGLTATLQSPTQFAHTIPIWPDFIPVTNIPKNITDAAIKLTSVQLKSRASRAMTLSATPGGRPGPLAIAQAGALSDLGIAKSLLHSYIIPVQR